MVKSWQFKYAAQRVDLNTVHLTPSAKHLLRASPKEFIRQHGDYFCAGFVAGGSLLSIQTWEFETAEEAAKFQIKTSAKGSGGIGGVNGKASVSGTDTTESASSRRFCKGTAQLDSVGWPRGLTPPDQARCTAGHVVLVCACVGQH